MPLAWIILPRTLSVAEKVLQGRSFDAEAGVAYVITENTVRCGKGIKRV
jgi:hypothetical protein